MHERIARRQNPTARTFFQFPAVVRGLRSHELEGDENGYTWQKKAEEEEQVVLSAQIMKQQAPATYMEWLR